MATIGNPLAGRITADRDVGYEHRRALGLYLVDLRIKRGLTQRDVGRAMGISNTAISAIELGRNSVPPERYEEWADLMGVSHRTFGKVMLKHSNPWLFAMLYPNETDAKAVDMIPERIGDDRSDNGQHYS